MKPKHKRGVEIYTGWETVKGVEQKVWRCRVRGKNGKIVGPTESFSSRSKTVLSLWALYRELKFYFNET